MVGNLLGPADRTEEHRVVSADLVLPVVGQHLLVLLVVVPGGEIEVVEGQIDLEPGRGLFEHANALGDDFLADAVPGNDGDSLRTHRDRSFTRVLALAESSASYCDFGERDSSPPQIAQLKAGSSTQIAFDVR